MKFYTKFHSLFFAKKLHVGVVAFCILTSIIFSNFASIANAAAGVPSIINFQGRLMDNSGDLLGGPSGTNYCYRFSIYSATTGGTKLWPAGTPSTMTILTREGVFDAPVGDVSAGGDSLTYDFQTSDTTFMNVEVNTTPGTCSGTWESLSPRPQIVSAAYAINSGTVQGLAPTQSASGNQLPQLTSDALVLGGTSAGVKSTSTNALTFNAGASGDVQFFSSANKITSGGALTIAGLMTSAGLTSSAPVNVTSQSATALTVARTGTNYALQVDTNTASSVTGLKVTSAAAGGGLAISVISSGTDENLTIDAKGAGSISIGGNSTGDVLLAGGAGATGCTIANSTGTLSCTVGITASAIRLDQITAATTSDTDNDNLNNNISWAWSTATTQTPLTLTANGSTTGSILSLTSSSAAATTGQKGLNVALTGALTGAQTTYGGYFSNTRTGASAVNVGLYATASGATGGNYAAIFDAGNVGIGTAAPQAQLEITGNFRLADQQTDTNASNGIIYKDGTPFIHNFRHATGGGARPNGNNTFVGLSAGNLTMGSTATVPYQASNNSGFGYQAFTSNTTGYYSSAFGFQALNSNTSGYSNSAFGMYALKLNDTGYSNSAMGIYALERNTSGYYNAALGYFAGGVIADGSTSNQTSNTSVYLGASTKALADGDSNEIVIGYNTTGFGSNTAAYGNSSITKHVFQTGEVMVGSTSDLGTYALQVTGNAYVTGQIDFGSTGTGQGSLYKSGTAAILASTGTLQLSAGSGNRVQILVDNGARRAFYTTDGKFLFGGGSGETYGGIGSDNGTGALVFYYDDSSNSPNEAARFSNAGLFSTVNNTITDTNSLFDLNLTLGNDATADTISALNIDVTSTATGADGDILYGINVANLTSADADVAESAIRVGTGWDNIFTSANASLTQAGALTVTSCTGCGGGGSTNWDTIGDPSAGADIAFGTTAQTITSTATTQNPLSLIGNSLTSGKLFSLTSTATAFTGNLANFTLSGSNAANTGSLVQVDNTGTSNANTSLLINHYATGTGNLAFRVNDVSGDTSPFVIDGNGNVGIGQASPNTQLHIGPGTDVSDVASTNLAVFQNNGSSSISVRDASSNSEGYLYSDAGGVSFGSVTSHAVQIGASGGSAIFIDVSNNVNIGGDTTPNSIFTVGGASEFQVDISGNTSLFGGADLRFIETGGGTDFVAFQAPASVATSVTWTLPNADSSGCLQSNGSGALSIASCGGGGVAWSAITNPTGDLNLTFDAGEETVFTTNATTATAFSIASSTLSSGTLLDLTVTGTAGISSQKALNISTSGAVTGSNSTYGAYISNTHTGASATSVGLYATASGGQTNYAAQFAGGIFQSGGFASFNIGSSVFGVASTTYPDYIFTINDGVIAIGDYNGPDLNNTYLLVDDTNSVISANASSGFVFGGSNFELYPTTTSGDGFYVSANTITTGKGITVQSSSLTSGALMDLTSTGTGALTGQKGLNISLSGANGTGAQTTYGAYLSNTKTGTSNNVGLYATASGGASNYAIDAGNAIRLSSATATESRIYSATGVGYFGVSETTAQANMYYNNNFITVATGSISLNTGGNEKVNIGTSATVINENSLDYDFRIEGDTDANLFFTDASTDRVAIGTNTPRNAFTLENNVGGTAIGSVTATAGDLSTEWNNISQFKIQNDRDLGGGNALAFFVSGTSNERKAFIQSGHSDGTNANNLGDLILNPFGGNIGIGGDLSPNALFSVGSTSQFQVNSSGAIAAATGITSSGTITFSGLGGAGTKCLQTDNSGVVTAAASACGSGGGLTVGTTAITSGGTNRVLYENGSNILSESADFTYDGTTLGVATSSTTASNKALNIAQTGGTTGTDYAGYFSNTGAATTNVGLYATASGGTTNLALNVDAGQTLLGGTTLSTGTLAKLNIVSTMSSNGSTTAIAGIHGDYTFNNGGTASFVQVGNRFVFNNAPTTNSNTMVGEVIRTVDNTSLANLVRGIEITSNAGSNTAGTNTGLRSTGATFGVQAITNGAAGGVSVPAGLYAENTGTTQGDVARFYTGSMTSAASMLSVYHDTSTFTGDALLMDMAVGSGTFSGDFVEFKNASVTKFKVTSAGVVSMGLSGTASTNALCSSLANATAPTAGTAYEIRDCNAAPAADYAEMYPVEEGAEFGDIVATGTEMVNTYDVTDGNVDWNKLKGTITRMVKTTQSYQSNVIGIVVDNYGDFSSVGHNIKEEDNPMPVALNGRVPVKIASDSDPIMPGDYITTSGTEPGKGQKAKKSGQVLGKALEVWTPGSGAQTVMVYVEQGFYNGIGVSQFAGIEATTPNFANQVLALLINTPPATVSVSEILTDRLVAGLEIITPKLYAQTIATDGLVSATGEKITISSPVEFVLPPVYNKDTAGYALIKQGDKRVRVTFAQSYVATPIVNVSMTFETEDDIDDDEAAILFSDDIRFIINSKDQTGFTILLNKSATRDIRFSWNALSVKDPTIFESLVEGLVIEPENNQNNENTPPAPSGEGGESGGSDQSPPDSGENPDSEVAPEDNGPSIDQLLDPEPQSSGDSTPPEEPSF